MAARIAMVVAAAPWAGAAARADTILEWNVIALQTTGAAAFDPPVETRTLAIVHAAVFDAVNAVTREFRPYAVEVEAPAGASVDAAAAAAAHHVLVRLQPEQRAALDAALHATLSRLPEGEPRSAGVGVGVEVAERLLELRADDGAAGAGTTPHAPRAGPGRWVPTPPPFRPALDPGWASVRPFLLRSAEQFRPGPPPEPTSRRYALDLAEVRALGSATSAERSPAQTELARLWVATAPQIWNAVARQAANARGLGPAATARLLALLNLSGADAFIASWDAKFFYEQWRPVTAIRAADADGNPRTAPDPGWTPLLVTPPFPDYIAGHTTYAGAAAEVLAELVGELDGVSLVVTSATAPGVELRYASFAAIARDVVEARVLGGVHWRTSCTEGSRVGKRIGRFAVRHFLRPSEEAVLAGEDPSTRPGR